MSKPHYVVRNGQLVQSLRPAAGAAHARTTDQQTADGFVNPFTRTGFGTQNVSSTGRFDPNTISRNRMELEWAYRGNWVARTAVDAPAEDMTRMGVEIQSEDKPGDLDELHKNIERKRVWHKLCQTEKWARLYGGALGFLMIEGQEPHTPLDLDTIGQGQFKGVLPLDRWMVWPDTNDIITDLGPDFGLPKFYKLWPDVGTGMPITRIHHSRVIRLDGEELPYWQRISENYWGLSVLEPAWDRIMAFDSATLGAAQLVYKAHLRVARIEGLRDALGSNDVARQTITQFFDMVRLLQSSEGMTLLDKEDEFAVMSYSFEGLDDIIMTFGQQLCGAWKIPAVRFFGMSPSGLNATGESDWRNYYDGIHAAQEQRLRPGVELIYELEYRSTFGRRPAKPLTIKFSPLWQLSDQDSATVVGTLASAIAALMEKGVFGRTQALKELRTASNVTGFGTNITDDDIATAEKQDEEMNESPPLPFLSAKPADPADSDPNAGRKGAKASNPRPH